MISSLTLSFLLLTQPKPAHAPKWLDFMLAGYEFAYDQKHEQTAVLDPNTHFMLLRIPECDGGDMTLLLTRDRYEVDGMGVDIPGFSKNAADKEYHCVIKPLPSLSTGKGVRIGMDTETVQAKLGGSSARFKTGSRKQFLNLKYSWQDGKDDGSRLYEETYVFKQDKLIEVLFSWGPGDDQTDKAVVAPAAKKAIKDRQQD